MANCKGCNLEFEDVQLYNGKCQVCRDIETALEENKRQHESIHNILADAHQRQETARRTKKNKSIGEGDGKGRVEDMSLG